MLCPVICCSENGAVLVVRAATPLTVAERDHLIDTDGFPDWDYLPWEGEAEPFEYKASDWGWLDGHLLSLDYSAPALTTAEEMAQIIANRQS
jgi:hypothetical protein